MKRTSSYLKMTLLLSLISMLSAIAVDTTYNRTEFCQNVLNWIYKDLTMKNLDKSIERTKKKIFSAVIITLKNKPTGTLSHNSKLSSLWKSMKEIDPNFEKYLNENEPYKKLMNYNSWDSFRGKPHPQDIKSFRFFKAIKEWKSLQEKQPELFVGLPASLMLDHWDIATSKIVDKIGNIDYQDTTIIENIKKMSNSLKSLNPNNQKTIIKDAQTILELERNLKLIQADIIKSITKIYEHNFNDYQSYCSKKDLKSILDKKFNKKYCSIKEVQSVPFSNLKLQLNQMAKVLNTKNFSNTYKPEKPLNLKSGISLKRNNVDLLCPIKIDYFKTTKPNKKATYSTREESLVDTVVIHHTGAGSNLKTNVEVFHRNQVNQSSEKSGYWYMIGYNYLISMGGNGSSLKQPVIIEGRKSHVRGSHAGGNTLPLSPQRINNLYNTFQSFNCKEDLSQIRSNQRSINKKNICEEKEEIKANPFKCAGTNTNIIDLKNNRSVNGNITTVGVAIVGNFDTDSKIKFAGKEIYSSQELHVSRVQDSLIPKMVSLINALKKDYPNLKKIVPHNYFKATKCPGTVRLILAKVAAQTGLEVYLSKEENFEKNKNGNLKHLKQFKRNGRIQYTYKDSYKKKYKSFLNISQNIKNNERAIVNLKTKAFKEETNPNQSEINRVTKILEGLYIKKDAISKELRL